MKKEHIEAAEVEAQRFLDRCAAAKEAFKYHKFNSQNGGYFSNEDTKATAALRRASMDLTRALADVRRPS